MLSLTRSSQFTYRELLSALSHITDTVCINFYYDQPETCLGYLTIVPSVRTIYKQACTEYCSTHYL